MTHDLFRFHAPSQVRRPEATGGVPTRASLEGLEVSESSFGEWLKAGGERRGPQRADDRDDPPPQP